MPSTVLFIVATILLSLNLVRPLGLAISDWLYFGALGFAFVETFTIQRFDAPCWWRNRFLWPVSLILFGAIVSTMNSQDWVVAIIEIIQQIFVLTLFISMAWILVRRGKIAVVINAFIFSGIFTAGVVLVDNFTGSRLGPILSGTPDVQFWGRFAGTLGHPNKLGYFLVLTTLLSIGQLLNIKASRTRFLPSLVWCAMILMQVYGVYLSGSMTAYLGLLAGIVIVVFSLKRIISTTTITLGVAALTVIFSFCYILAPPFTLLKSLETENNNIITQAVIRVQTSTAGSRLAIYAQVLDRITQNPWFGVGYDQISTSGISPEVRYLDFSVHNPLLEIWYTGGLFALVGWLAIYIFVGWIAIRLIRWGKDHTLSPLVVSLAAAVLAALLMDQFQDAVYQREKWLVIGLLVGFSWGGIRGERVGPDQAADRWTISDLNHATRG